MRDYFILNELQVPKLLFKVLTGHKPVVLHIWPLVQKNRGWLTRLSNRLLAARRLTDPFARFPDWERFKEKQGGVEAYGFYTDAYMKLEPAQDNYFDFAGLGNRIPDYAQAMRHRIATHYTDLHWLVFAFRDLGRNDRVHGLPEEVALYADAYVNRKASCRVVPSWRLAPLLNLVTWMSATLYSLVWISRHYVRKRPDRKTYELGADLLQVLRHLYVTREMVDDDADCLIVFRTPDFRTMYKDRIGDMDHCLVTEGCVPASELRGFLSIALKDHARLFRQAWRYEPGLYRRMASLPHWRIVFRALLEKHHLKRFLARDDYNGEHSIRTQELRRAGAMSIGIGHGLPTTNRISPVFRFLDFDYYLTFSKDLFEKFYRQTFTPGTKIVGIGSIGLTREGLARLGEPRPQDVIVFMSSDLETPRYVEMVQEIARRFPDRRFICKIKESQFSHGTAGEFLDAIAAGPDNLVESREDSYELMLCGRYAISNDSTVIAESISYGQCCFMYDVYDEVAPEDGHPSIYRDYPELCVATPDQFEQRIRSIEDGAWRYPRERFGGLIDVSGLNPFDRIRDTIGLTPKEPLEPMKTDAA
jgi:hypothetical protein